MHGSGSPDDDSPVTRKKEHRMSNGTYDLKWGQELAGRISPQIRSQVGMLRLDPPLIPIVPGKAAYEDVVQSFRVNPGPPVSIKPSAKLAPVKISLEFMLAQQQFTDELLAARLALRPAADLAFVEDAILLHGKRAADVLKRVGVKDENGTLEEQEGLFVKGPEKIDGKKTIDVSVLEGIQKLRDAQQYGPYCVIVSPDLHREAMTPLGDSGVPRIAPILPQLRENGFRFSPAASERTGVIVSLGGAAVDLSVLWDVHVECRTVEGDATFVVVEQIRLRLNDPRAVVTLS
jgi:uncharacterized linocin/CFP29 family protein